MSKCTNSKESENNVDVIGQVSDGLAIHVGEAPVQPQSTEKGAPSTVRQ